MYAARVQAVYAVLVTPGWRKGLIQRRTREPRVPPTGLTDMNDKRLRLTESSLKTASTDQSGLAVAASLPVEPLFVSRV